MSVRTLIIDDEPSARRLMLDMISVYCPELGPVSMAGTVDEALALVQKEGFDLVFLDVQMPEKNGFDFLSALTNINFKTVFVTAYDHYAIRAIKWSALDYILKPVNYQELQEAVRKYCSTAEEAFQDNRLSALKENHSLEAPKVLMVPSTNGYKRLRTAEIIYFQGERNYAWLHLENGSRMLVARSLKEYEEMLPYPAFLRIHKSFLINPEMVVGYITGRDAKLEMKDGSCLAISRTRKEQVLKLLGDTSYRQTM